MIMSNIKSHFAFTKKQRNGIFVLLSLIVFFQILYFTIDFNDDLNVDESVIKQFEQELDSLKQLKLAQKNPTIYPFNPNFITDYKGYTLGMTNEEIDRLHQFRAKNQWINSAEQFQQVTQISDSLLEIIAPYFKFPEWVTQPKPKPIAQKFDDSTPKSFEQKIDLNQATSSQLQAVYGVGKVLSQRIIDYRAKNGGFAAMVELQEIYGLSQEVIQRISNNFTVKTPRHINRINLNKANRDELVTIKYIDYEVAFNIIEERTLREGFKSLDELTKVEGFPVHKFDIIKLYLTIE